MARITRTTVAMTWVASSSFRRSTMSARAPAGRTNRTNGSDDEVWTRPTSVADRDSSVISHAEPTFSIQSPMFEASAANQRERNVARPSGANGPPWRWPVCRSGRRG